MKKNLIILLLFICLIGGMTLFDFIRSRSIDIAVVSVQPEKVVADPSVPVHVTVRVTKNGRPVTGHKISALVVGAGNLKADRKIADKDGVVTFDYFPYRYQAGVYEEMKVKLVICDISDSILVAVQKDKTIVLDVKKPDNIGSSDNMSSIFGEG